MLTGEGWRQVLRKCRSNSESEKNAVLREVLLHDYEAALSRASKIKGISDFIKEMYEEADIPFDELL